jgi:hypothetical protein
MHWLRQPAFAVFLVLALIGAAPRPALAETRHGVVILVPPGNRSLKQPPISGSSIKRTLETGGTFDAKFKLIYQSLAKDRALIGKIEKVAGVYGIDPIDIIGAIIGEHTYNVDVLDNLQGYYLKAVEYVGADVEFAFHGQSVDDFVARPEFKGCGVAKGDYDLWSCREDVWKKSFQGKKVDGVAYPDDRFERVFFQPFFAGQTFGLGQISPLTALMVSDLVHEKSGLPELSTKRAPEVYQAVMDPDMCLNYMAAIIRHDIDVYRSVAGFDISHNPGITATLYNVGGTRARASALFAQNQRRRADGLSVRYPEENYYGWLVNSKLSELKKLL